MSEFVSPAEGRLTSGWGARPPLNYHYGIDIAPPVPGQKGCPVFAAYGGTVVAVNDGSKPNTITGTWNTGSYVKIDGPGGGSEWYGHLATIDVKRGDKVKAGDKLGTMGDVGQVTGTHLHLEFWDRHTRSPRNPMIDFRKHGIRPGSRPEVVTMAKLDRDDYENITRNIMEYVPKGSRISIANLIFQTWDKTVKTNTAMGRLERAKTAIANVYRPNKK